MALDRGEEEERKKERERGDKSRSRPRRETERIMEVMRMKEELEGNKGRERRG